MAQSIEIKTFTGNSIEPYISDLARLRIEIFRDFPYLYEGSIAYEEKYLSTYSQSPESFFAVAFDVERVVGMSTGVPMADETEEFKQPFIEQGYDPESIFYFGESVLEKAYRGQGIGVRFFEEREGYATSLGRFTHTAFCAVERSGDHPARPSNYQPLDAFWHNRGYRKYPELKTEYAWLDVGDTEETSKPMIFWMKRLVTE